MTRPLTKFISLPIHGNNAIILVIYGTLAFLLENAAYCFNYHAGKQKFKKDRSRPLFLWCLMQVLFADPLRAP